MVADTLVMTGAGTDDDPIDTLSKITVAKAEGVPPTAKPTYTFEAMVTVWLFPSCVQFTPSEET